MQSRRPNVVIVIMDDLGWGDLACHGNPHLWTPHLDRMHDESLRLTRYCSGPLCSPARAGLITGRYHLRTRVVDTYCGRSMLDPDEPSMAALLKNAGYRTAAFGKWHLGDCYPMRAMDRGFDETLMHLAGGVGQPGDPENYARWQSTSYFDPVLYRNGKPEVCSGYCTDIFFDEALRFIESHRDEPFFVYLATNAPHTPLLVPEKYSQPYLKQGLPRQHALLYGMVTNIDDNMGRLFACLEHNGLERETLVIFTSDHGPCGSSMAKNDDGYRYNAGLRGLKGTLYEGGVRVPCFWRWKGKLEAGTEVDHVTSPIDILPTVLAVTGIEALALDSNKHRMDGVNLYPFLFDQPGANWPRNELFMQWHRGDVPVLYRNYAVIETRYKLYRSREDRPDELYDLQEDPCEATNLAECFPEKVFEMRKRYEQWFHEVSATHGPDTYDPPRIAIGTPFENPTLLNQNDWRVGLQEGWNRDDICGHWLVEIRTSGIYRVSLHFSREIPPGMLYLRINERRWCENSPATASAYCFERLELHAGQAEIQGWCELKTQDPTCFCHRFLPVLYLKIFKEE